MNLATIADKDPWLEPYRSKLEAQQAYIRQAERRLLGGDSLENWALGHLYFGLHKTDKGWVLREWAPNATAVYLLSEINDWRDNDAYLFERRDHGVWELLLPLELLSHGDHYKLRIHWKGGSGERIPAYARSRIQTLIYSTRWCGSQKNHTSGSMSPRLVRKCR